MLGAFEIGAFCSQTAGILQYVGYVVTIVKIAIPILIFVYGIFDLGKAIINSKSEETTNAIKRLIWRLVAGIAIFFLPNLVLWLFGTISFYENDAAEGWATCKDCILSPGSNKCDTSQSYAEQ